MLLRSSPSDLRAPATLQEYWAHGVTGGGFWRGLFCHIIYAYSTSIRVVGLVCLVLSQSVNLLPCVAGAWFIIDMQQGCCLSESNEIDYSTINHYNTMEEPTFWRKKGYPVSSACLVWLM